VIEVGIPGSAIAPDLIAAVHLVLAHRAGIGIDHES
jgi:hypothetical protein